MSDTTIAFRKRVLVVDDEIDMSEALRVSLIRCGYEPTVCNDPLDAINLPNLHDFAIIITDMKMPQLSGIELIEAVRKRGIFAPIIVITGFGTVQNAVQAMKLGATDYLLKPFDFDTLKSLIDRLTVSVDTDFVAHSPVMKRLLSIIDEVAKSDITVLISGQSGTGKEVIARRIHAISNRSDKPFVAVNCAAISETLLESEMFGYEKGAFTGALQRKIGKFELADKGTLLLDEISEMALPLQAKLLRVIQEREIDRIGGKSPIKVDVRIVATTNRDLLSEVQKGTFRQDLYYRLNVFPIEVPPLKDRPEDIIPLAEFFASRLSTKLNRALTLSEELKKTLLNHKWQGNVRELQNYIHRLAVLSKTDTLQNIDDILPTVPEKASDETVAPKIAGTFTGTLKDMQKEMILQALKECGGDKELAAKKLGITSRTIRNKLKEYNIT